MGVWRGCRPATVRLLILFMALAAFPVPAAARSTPEPAAEVPEVPGPRRTVAVGTIDAVASFAGAQGWDVGGSLAAMLTSALVDSGRFMVVERALLPEVLTEQEMAASRVASGSAAPLPGKMIPAQYMIFGSVTEFGTRDRGSGLSIGGASGALGGGLGFNRSGGKVTLDLRLVNTRSGQVEKSFTVSRWLSRTGVALTGGYKGIALGGDKFWSTPLGEATRGALADAVVEIARGVASSPWEGLVVEAEGHQLIVNAGGEAGLRPGDRMLIERPTRTLTDPATGQVLGQRRQRLGEVVLTSIEPKLATGTFVPADPATPAPTRGDLVVPVSGTE